jgi:hypothetical protein
MAVISALEDKAPSDTRAMLEAVALDELGSGQKSKNATSKSSLKELLAGGRGQNFRRVMLGVTIQCFQQVHDFLVEGRHNLTPTFRLQGSTLSHIMRQVYHDK